MQRELAQLNIARMQAPIDSPQLADFVAELDGINALADGAQGFVWRLQSDQGDATEVPHDFGPDMLVNMSVWASVDDLHQFIYRTAHATVMSRRREWFERMADAYQVLWWVPAGYRPTLVEARQRLDRLRRKGPTPEAFTFKQAFPPPAIR